LCGGSGSEATEDEYQDCHWISGFHKSNRTVNGRGRVNAVANSQNLIHASGFRRAALATRPGKYHRFIAVKISGFVDISNRNWPDPPLSFTAQSPLPLTVRTKHPLVRLAECRPVL